MYEILLHGVQAASVMLGPFTRSLEDGTAIGVQKLAYDWSGIHVCTDRSCLLADHAWSTMWEIFAIFRYARRLARSRRCC